MSDNHMQQVHNLLNRYSQIDSTAYRDIQNALSIMKHRQYRKAHFPIGTRVKAIRDIDSFENDIQPAGALGAVTYNTSAIGIKFDNGAYIEAFKWHVEIVE